MCFNGDDDSPLGNIFKDLKEVGSSLKFIYVAHGIILPTIILVGVVFNAMCLVVLCRTSLRSAPYCLLQSLTVCDILIMLFSIYSDVEPAIRAKIQLDEVSAKIFPSCQALDALKHQLLNQNATHMPRFPFITSSGNDSMGSGRQGNTTDKELFGDEDLSDQLLLLLLHELLSSSETADIKKVEESKPASTILHGAHMANDLDDVFSATFPKQNGPESATAWSSSQTIPTLDVDISYPKRLMLWSTYSPLQSLSIQGTTKKSPSMTDMMRDQDQTTVSYSKHTTDNTTSSLHGIAINTRPVVQAAERWFAYSLMTFNLGVTLTMASERCLAVTFPFRARTLLTPKRTCMTILTLLLLTLAIHTPQFLKEVFMFVNSPEQLKDDFQGKMIQSFRQIYERFVVYFTSAMLILVLILNLMLIRALAVYRSKIKQKEQPGNRKHVDVNITIVIVVLVFLQLPHNIAMNVLTTLSLEGFSANVASFTRAVVVIRVLYVANSAFNCITYCLLSRRFRVHFLQTYPHRVCRCFRKWSSSNATEERGQRQPQTTTMCTTSSSVRGSMTSLTKYRMSTTPMSKSQTSLNSVATQQEIRSILAKYEKEQKGRVEV